MEHTFRAVFGSSPQAVFSAAGRVNLIGEHVDYCGGQVLPAALSLKCRVAVRRNRTNVLRIAATDLKGITEIDLRRLDSYRNLPWGNYQAGVADEMQKAGYRLVGCDLLYDCTVPYGAGLSSSAAIEVATAYALAKAGGNSVDPVRLAVLCRAAENNYCGVNCGIMDQFASANGKKKHAVLLDCATLAHAFIPFDPKGYTLILADSKKAHSLAASKYNERRAETEAALSVLHESCGAASLAAVSEEELERARPLLLPTVYRRARHVVGECARVKEAVRALNGGDLARFGELLNASHRSLRDDYEVTGSELDALWAAASEREECLGARMTGAGFGGCTVNLVAREKKEAFVRAVGAKYLETTGKTAAFYEAEIADGLMEEWSDL